MSFRHPQVHAVVTARLRGRKQDNPSPQHRGNQVCESVKAAHLGRSESPISDSTPDRQAPRRLNATVPIPASRHAFRAPAGRRSRLTRRRPRRATRLRHTSRPAQRRRACPRRHCCVGRKQDNSSSPDRRDSVCESVRAAQLGRSESPVSDSTRDQKAPRPLNATVPTDPIASRETPVHDAQTGFRHPHEGRCRTRLRIGCRGRGSRIGSGVCGGS